MSSYPLDLGRADVEKLGHRAVDFVADYLEELSGEPTLYDTDTSALVTRLLDAPPERPGDLEELLTTIGEAASSGMNTASPGYLAYFPAGGLTSSAFGELIAESLNRYTAFAELAPGLVAIEQSVLRWLCGEFALPAGSGGLVLTGGSMATLPAIVAARDSRVAGEVGRGVVYVSEHTHHCIAKAAHIAGLTRAQIRILPSSADLRTDVAAVARQVQQDRRAGLLPFLLVATAGATSTGLVDPLEELGALARREGLWFHVDGAYGAPYQLTDRGRRLLRGIEAADSIVLDPHKSMFLPYGTGILLVRDEQALRAAHTADADYLQDIGQAGGLPDYAHLGPELTRESRGLRLWLPLHLHGVAAFREALNEKLDLTRWIYGELACEPALELPWVPDLTVIGFRLRGDGAAAAEANRLLLEQINASRRVCLSTTRVAGRYTLRLCLQSVRSHAEQAAEAVDLIRAAVHDLAASRGTRRRTTSAT